MSLLRSPLSVQTKWTLRYTGALLLSVSLCALYAYDRIDRELGQDLEMLLELQMREIVRELASGSQDPDHVTRYVEQHVVSGEDDVNLGIALFGTDGALRLARGFRNDRVPDLPEGFLASGARQAAWDADLGSRYPYRVLARRADGTIAVVAIHTRRFVRDARHLARNFALALVIVTVLTAGIGYWLARGSLRPIAEITATARRIGAASLDARIPTTGAGDELDQLAATLNDMLDRLRRGVERMRQFTADAAHELRTPLAALRNQIEVTLEKERSTAEYHAVLGGLLEEAERLADAVHAMLRLASSEAGLDPASRVPVPLVPLLDEVVDFFAPVAEEHAVELRREPCPEVTLSGDRTWLHQLFANLVHNAIKYTPAGGRVTVSASLHGERVAVRVRDTGIGIAADEHERVFARFHRTGAAPGAPGVGLGLPIAREIARAHGGEIALESAPGAGAIFTVWLPVGGGAARG